MGMFDYVKFSAPCIKCGEKIQGFQSKDGPCELKHLDYWEVDYFYANCKKCDTWNEYHRINKKPFAPISDYEAVLDHRFN